jgi:FtsZ-binding cell division protein ZapB
VSARLAAVAAALALAACASPPEAPPEEQAAVVAVAPPTVEKKAPIVAPVPAPVAKPERIVVPTEPKTNEVDSLLAEFERLRRLPAAELPREQELARQAFNQSRSDAARVRLAIASSVPGSAAVEESRALELLDPLVKNPTAALHGLAFMLSAFIQEQRKLVATAQGLQQNAQAMEKNNQALQQNVHGLQQKLDALRTLERSLSERGEAAPRRR